MAASLFSNHFQNGLRMHLPPTHPTDDSSNPTVPLVCLDLAKHARHQTYPRFYSPCLDSFLLFSGQRDCVRCVLFPAGWSLKEHHLLGVTQPQQGLGNWRLWIGAGAMLNKTQNVGVGHISRGFLSVAHTLSHRFLFLDSQQELPAAKFLEVLVRFMLMPGTGLLASKPGCILTRENLAIVVAPGLLGIS